MRERANRENIPGSTGIRLLDLTAIGQGLFYAATGAWSFVSRRSFEKVTGPKTDYWLVQTVGALVLVIGLLLTSAGMRKSVDRENVFLGIGSAASLAAVDILYTAKKRISPVYLLDAAAEIGLIGLWLIGRKSASGK